MEKKDFTEKNRLAWNEAAIKHKTARQKKGDPLLQEGFVDLDPTIIEFFKNHADPKGKRIVNICCNDGRETISLKRMGTGECVGFDISDEAILTARNLARATGMDCKFIRADVYDIDPSVHGQFDLAFISAGALCWLPDLDGLFAIVSALLRPGGNLLIYEIHPFVWMLEDAPGDNPLQISGNYFKDGPVVNYGTLDYVGNEDYEGQVNYSFDHTMGEIITSVSRAGFRIEIFKEFPHDVSAEFDHLEKSNLQLPLSYILYGTRETEG